MMPLLPPTRPKQCVRSCAPTGPVSGDAKQQDSSRTLAGLVSTSTTSASWMACRYESHRSRASSFETSWLRKERAFQTARGRAEEGAGAEKAGDSNSIRATWVGFSTVAGPLSYGAPLQNSDSRDPNRCRNALARGSMPHGSAVPSRCAVPPSLCVHSQNAFLEHVVEVTCPACHEHPSRKSAD